MKKIALTAAAALAITVMAAPAAQAYDAKAYSYAAGHMLQPKNVPATFGVNSRLDFNATRAFPIFVCSVDSNEVKVPGGVHVFNANYVSKKVEGNLSVSVNQYASPVKAIAAFNALKKAVTKCSGQKTGSSTFEDGSTDTWARLTTTGTVPAVTITGVPSVFLNANYTDVASGPEGSEYTSDQYSVYTLVDNVVIATNYYTGSELNISTNKRKAVNQTAFNAVTAWLG
jgi:hypothetical protein